ncbi:hypothetical protein [Magnetospirillum sp. UT-4]|uniref:hypothetical protein n=1 Tax=Magnetospirillum sp. UT-4 TaxID=2681467 RepID=UPI00137FDAC3|nr:hypothetical protein [Magnetospirillum sp. UT-4]CAA7616848.1 conserved hypothetical protein [Magnetospirillum sp. UT-4]
MGFSTVLIISLAAGVILIVGGGLMMYMGNLVKSAYEIKVQINTEVEERLGKMGEDLDKKSRWIKRDLLEEIEKIKANMHAENAAKVGELLTPLLARIETLEAALKNERADWNKAVESDRAMLTNLDNRVKALTKQIKGGDATGEPAAKPTPPAAGAPAAGAAPAPAPAPAKPATAAPVSQTLQEF